MYYKYIDIGVNLYNKQFKGKEEELKRLSDSAGVAMIVTGSDFNSSKKALESEFMCTVGFHPHAASTFDKKNELLLEEMVKHKNVVAVGETGLDYDRMFSPLEKQIESFEKHIDIARRVEKPLFLHERKAVDDFYEILKKNRDMASKSVVHCFTGNKETVMRYLNLGCMIGITGWICDSRRNKDLLEAIKVIPINRLMIETDAPYLTPYKELGHCNMPSNIIYVVDKIAELKKVDKEKLRETVFNNTERFFGVSVNEKV